MPEVVFHRLLFTKTCTEMSSLYKFYIFMRLYTKPPVHTHTHKRTLKKEKQSMIIMYIIRMSNDIVQWNVSVVRCIMLLCKRLNQILSLKNCISFPFFFFLDVLYVLWWFVAIVLVDGNTSSWWIGKKNVWCSLKNWFRLCFTVMKLINYKGTMLFYICSPNVCAYH